ncbi:tyrosyl-tRNA synthetase [Oleoguttula sp. CCFEE 5521]
MSRPVAHRIAQVRPYVCATCLRGGRRGGQPIRLFSDGKVRRSERLPESIGVLELLEARGYIKDIAGDRNVLSNLLRKKQVGVYAGVDPTAPSLHLGHLLPLMVLFWFYLHGHHAVSLVGGATARVGDPSGRLKSRERTASSIHASNAQSLHVEVEKLWQNATAAGQKHGYECKTDWRRQLLDNADWLGKVDIVSFLQLLGSGMRIGTMLGRDTVKNKLEKGDGMSFAEFSYPLLQAWDWWHMFSNHGVQLQIGGSDQYGNIIAGIDAIKHLAQTDQGSESSKLDDLTAPMGITVPLLTTSKGEKFGKSAGNAVWLDASLTSPFDLYGFLLRTSDQDLPRHLNLFTFLPAAAIDSLLKEHSKDPSKRLAHHVLATEVLQLVHGIEIAAETQTKHQEMRRPSLASLTRKPVTPGAERKAPNTDPDVTAEMHQEIIKLARSQVENTSIAKILHHAGLSPSVSAATRVLRSGGVYVASSEGSAVRDSEAEAASGDGLMFTPVSVDQKLGDIASFVKDGVIVVRMGKWKVRVIEVVDDSEVD